MLTRLCSCMARSCMERHETGKSHASSGAPPGSQFRRALVTGATSGIGAAFADILPATTDLLLTARNEEKLADTARRLSREGRAVEIIAADLANEDDIARVVSRADAFGIDLLINNAGIGRVGRIVDNPAKAERDTAAVNVLAVVLLTRGLLPGMIARARSTASRGGVIVVASTAAFAPVPYFATYAASKAFDLSFAEALGEEMRGEPIDVLALCPGATRTNFGRRAGSTVMEAPGAADPRTVARQALRALGRQRIKVTGGLSEAAFSPFLLPRRLITFGLGALMHIAAATRSGSNDQGETRMGGSRSAT